MRSTILKTLMTIAEQVGTIKRVNMYNDDFLSVEGTTADGRDFYVTLNVHDKEEDKTDGN